jgi:hypothetical protein
LRLTTFNFIAAPQAPAPAPRGPLPPSTPVIKGVAIFKNSPATPLQAVADGFASNGLFGAAAQEAERKVESVVNASALPKLFRSVGHKAVEASGLAGTIGDGKDKVVAKVDAAKAGASKVLDGAKKAPGEAKGLVQGLVQRARTQSLELVQAWLKQAVPQLEVGVKAAEEWWVRERVEKKAEMCLRRRELDVSIIEGNFILLFFANVVVTDSATHLQLYHISSWAVSRRTGMASSRRTFHGSLRHSCRSSLLWTPIMPNWSMHQPPLLRSSSGSSVRPGWCVGRCRMVSPFSFVVFTSR